MIELESGSLPYGLTPSAPIEEQLPYYEIPSWLLPRTIRGIAPGRRGLWVFTSSSVDLLDLVTHRILERHDISARLHAAGDAESALGGVAGGLIHETEGENPSCTFFLRTPQDRSLVRIAPQSGEGPGEQSHTVFEPGAQFPPPPYGGMALDESGDLLLAARRGMYFLERGAKRFTRVDPRESGVPRAYDAVVGLAARDFIVLNQGRAYRWNPSLRTPELFSDATGLCDLWRESSTQVAATDGHRLFQLEEHRHVAWSCAPTPSDVVIRSFGRAGSEGVHMVLDRENRLFLWERGAWRKLRVKEPVSDYSSVTHIEGCGLFINLDASLWLITPDAEFRPVLDYRVALARWVDQKGLRNVNFFFTSLLLGILLIALTGTFALPKGPIPGIPSPIRPWDGVHVVGVLLLFTLGQLAVKAAFDLCGLSSYPVLRASPVLLAARHPSRSG